MARFAIGDIQGCFSELMALLAQVNFDPSCDELFSVGDIVNRGPQSLEVLRWMYTHRDAVHLVLGNHDLHLLAVSKGYENKKSRDTLDDILHAPDREILLDWLRNQPLFLREDTFCLVHAGVWPGWRLDEVQRLAQEVSTLLQADSGQAFFKQLYGNRPVLWSTDLTDNDRLRFIVNSLTRMRVLYQDQSLDFDYKRRLDDMPSELQPWFAFPLSSDIPRVIFGHWSALGLKMTEQIWALDTGCVWGGQLTMVNCDTGEIFQEPSHRHTLLKDEGQ